jgi:hypothetical protein
MVFRGVRGICLSLWLIAGCGVSVAPTRDSGASMDAGVAESGTGDASARDGGANCVMARLSSLRMPSVVRGMERTPLAAVLERGGCDCQAQARSSGDRRHALSVCGCSIDPCVDPPYVVNWEDDPARGPTGNEVERIFVTADGAARTSEVLRIPAERVCSGAGVQIEGVTIETDNERRIVGPRRVWARVRGTVDRCSGSPPMFIETSGMNPVVVRPLDCSDGDCDGPTRPVPYEVWVSLGTFAPGTYSVFYSPGISQPFTVR